MKYGYFTFFEVFLKVLVIIILSFGENNVLEQKYIDIYRFQGFAEGGGAGVLGPTYFFFLFIQTEKVQEHDLFLNQILHHFC